MRKYLVMILFLMSVPIYGADKYQKYVSWDRDAFQLFYVKAGTETAATYDITTDSITLHVTGGFNCGPVENGMGSVSWKLSNMTFTEFRTMLATTSAISADTVFSTNTVCFQGDWIVRIPNDVWAGYKTTALEEVIISSNCYGESNIKTLAVDSSSMTVMTYYLPPSTGKKNILQSYIAQATSAGTITTTIFNASGTQSYPNVPMTTAVPCYVGNMTDNSPVYVGYVQSEIESRVTSTSSITAGWILINWTSE